MELIGSPLAIYPDSINRAAPATRAIATRPLSSLLESASRKSGTTLWGCPQFQISEKDLLPSATVHLSAGGDSQVLMFTESG